MSTESSELQKNSTHDTQSVPGTTEPTTPSTAIGRDTINQEGDKIPSKDEIPNPPAPNSDPEGDDDPPVFEGGHPRGPLNHPSGTKKGGVKPGRGPISHPSGTQKEGAGPGE